MEWEYPQCGPRGLEPLYFEFWFEGKKTDRNSKNNMAPNFDLGP